VRDDSPGACRSSRHRQGIPTTGLLAQVLVAKYADHLPLYRQEAIFGRAGLAIPAPRWRNGWACGVQLQPLVDA
jgi:transposase